MQIICRSANRHCKKSVPVKIKREHLRMAEAYHMDTTLPPVQFWKLFVDAPTIHALIDLEDAACGEMPYFILNGVRMTALLHMPPCERESIPAGCPTAGMVTLWPYSGNNPDDYAPVIFNHIKEVCFD